MDPKNTISFIPKKPLARTDQIGRRPLSLFLFVGLVIFFATWGAYGGVYFYVTDIRNRVMEKKASLDVFQNSYQSGVIKDARELKTKIEVAQQLVKSHQALSAVFAVLERETAEEIRFSSFSYTQSSLNETAKGKPTVLLQGEALSFAALAFQSDLAKELGDYAESNRIYNVSLTPEGKVSFTYELILKPDAFFYETMIASSTVETISGEELTRD